MQIKVIFSILLSGVLFLFFSCASEDILSESGNDTNPGIDFDVDEDFDTNSQEVNYSDAIAISFSVDGVSVDNPYEGKGVGITTDGSHLVVNSTLSDTEINYVLSGSTTNGSVKIYSDYKFVLVLNGVSLINTDGPALNIQSGKRVSVILQNETYNRLVDSKEYTINTTEDMKAAFFSEGQLLFSGKGSLEVVGRRKHAICSDDYIEISEGTIQVKAAASDGIHTNDYIRIDGGTIDIAVQGDGLECEKGYIEINGGNISIYTTLQKGHAIKSSDYCLVNDCELIDITVVGAGSKGFKTGGNLFIAKGDINIITKGDAFFDSDNNDIASPAGIKCDGNFAIEQGHLSITSSGKAGKGINVVGTSVFNNGMIAITTTGEQFTYNRESSSAKAVKSQGNLTVNDGTIQIYTTGKGAEGLESKSTLTIKGGLVEIEAYDDCINASRHIEINGGNIYCYSAGNDGVDSNGTLTVTGGVIISSGTTSPEDGFDCDNNTFSITGGILIGTGGSTSTPTTNACTQRTVIYGGSGTAHQLIHIQSDNGDNILTYQIPRTYSSMTFLYSGANLQANTNYTIYTGGSISEASEFHGYYTGGTYSGGTSTQTFTTTSMVTTVGRTSGMGGGGNQGGPGGRR